MRCIVANAAFWELGQYACRMLFAVAVLAVRVQSMLILMAERAGLLAVTCLGCGQQIVLFLVACGAEIRGRAAGVGYDLGHVRLMARFAVIRFDERRMRYMTVGALGHLSMYFMAAGTVLKCMLAPVFEQLLDLRGMAAETGLGHWCP